jgi:hypothetical protein
MFHHVVLSSRTSSAFQLIRSSNQWMRSGAPDLPVLPESSRSSAPAELSDPQIGTCRLPRRPTPAKPSWCGSPTAGLTVSSQTNEPEVCCS